MTRVTECRCRGLRRNAFLIKRTIQFVDDSLCIAAVSNTGYLRRRQHLIRQIFFGENGKAGPLRPGHPGRDLSGVGGWPLTLRL